MPKAKVLLRAKPGPTKRNKPLSNVNDSRAQCSFDFKIPNSISLLVSTPSTVTIDTRQSPVQSQRRRRPFRGCFSLFHQHLLSISDSRVSVALLPIGLSKSCGLARRPGLCCCTV